MTLGSTLTCGTDSLWATLASLPPAKTSGIPREVRCRQCLQLAQMERNERTGDDTIMVRYACPDCGWDQTRHFQESELDWDAI